MATREIIPARRPITGSIRPPGSRSLTNRALIVAALADGTSRIESVGLSDDTRILAEALRSLGIPVTVDGPARRMTVTGCGGRVPPGPKEINTGDSGTATRFMTALVAAGRGVYRVDGSPRMRQRPIQDLLDGLAALGVRARSEAGTGCPPVRIETAGLSGGEVCVSGSVSSQFVSALLMAAPAAARPVTIRVTGPLVSKPYVDMTLAVMAHFDCRLKIEDCRMQNAEQHQEPCVSSGLLPEFCNLQSAICIHVPAPAVYRACRYVVEPDASSASYFLAAAAATGGQVTVEGLGRDSAQGDVRFAEVLQEMGCEVAWGPQGVTVKGPAALRGVQVDLGAMPDMVLTLAPLALLARGRTVIRNVANLRVKESDRLAALAAELARLGAQVRQFPDGLEILPPETIRPAEVATYNDHRMAMGMSIVGLARPGVAIAGAECVSKTYPGFFEDLERLTEQQ